MLYGVHVAARKKPAKKATRRARNDGGLYEKHTTRLDPRTGKSVPYSYWQASRDVAPEHLPPGVERKRITGTGPTAALTVRCPRQRAAAFSAERAVA